MSQPTGSDVLSQAAAKYPDQTAIRDPDRDVTRSFADLDDGAKRVAVGLRELGFEPGDHLTAILVDSVEFLELMFACAHAGLVFNPISSRMAPERLAYVLDHAESAGLVFDTHCQGTVAEVAAEDRPSTLIGVRTDDSLADHAYSSLGQDAAPEVLESGREYHVSIDESDPALLLYTSGTTGQPKGVLHTHRNVVEATYASLPYNRFRPTDVNLALGPMYHVGPLLCNILPGLSMGATTVVQQEFDPGTTLEWIESEGITAMWGVPTHYRALVDDESISGRDISHLRMLQYSGAAMPEVVARRCREHVPGCEFVNAYGTTEIVFGTVLFPEFHDDKLGSIGRAVPKAEVRVVDPENPEPDAVLPSNEVGELLVKTPSCMREYWRNPEATADAIVDGWYRTGDLGRRDEDDFLYFVDRKDDMIVSGGENIYPAEVEDVLHDHSDVTAGAVVGVPDEEWGAVVTAFVVPGDESLTADKLESHFTASDAIESYKRPRRYEFRDELPMTQSDKIDRQALLESVADE
ncbi:long-chain-fatty-acid--CoA ligase [Natrialba hulunbeirensis JCM 10989]|uniref:Long-chain-fatty-acid--CoA ligase n=1 Tax=Natrialba hulunbeirensis JCM 10989 TaxID=1227493 RepID=M0A434_9EURY|nr:AMP-binding protein [Natrialba hulunbeirensis]ELY92103.1 long-chain-fatty-acid--CoA ligase [Natrialba hulunbeirensis JCM 10989]